MQKIVRGNGARGALNYVARGKDARLIGGNMSGKTPRGLSAEFGIARKTRDCKKPVWHSSLRLPAGERLNDETWNVIAQNYMNEMGFSKLHQYCVYIHDVPEGQHIHIVGSRIGLDGSLYYGQNENLKSTQVISRLEKQFSLTPTKPAQTDKRTGLPKTSCKRKRSKRGEIEKAARTGEKSPRTIIQDVVSAVLTCAHNLNQFEMDLEQRGISVCTKRNALGEVFGISYAYRGSKFSGTSLGDAFKASRVVLRLSQNSKVGLHVESLACGGYASLTLRISNAHKEWTEWRDKAGTTWFYRNDEVPRMSRKSGYSLSKDLQAVLVHDHAFETVGIAQAAQRALSIAISIGLAPPLQIFGTEEFQCEAARVAFAAGIEISNKSDFAGKEFDLLRQSSRLLDLAGLVKKESAVSNQPLSVAAGLNQDVPRTPSHQRLRM